MRILGLDPGTALLGWGLIDTGPQHDLHRAECLGYDCLRTDKSQTDSQRLVALANGLEVLLKQYQPDLVAVEKLFFARNQKTVMTVSQARGVILLQIERQHLPLQEYTPLQVKQALTGYGQADKKQIQAMVQLLLHLGEVPKPDDAADALAIALTAGQATRLPLLHLQNNK